VKVTLIESGGLAAGMRRPPRTVDTANLSAAEAAELERLVAAVEAAPAPSAGPGRARDAMSYTIKLEAPGKAPATITRSDTDLTAAFGDLLAWIKRRAGKG
jgi:hypothetical protein